ncbi:putative late blight resistance protein -like protein R1B-12-like [Capsicum annuum]|nr:putative late blight resistance protein -like protein R1B-12-like [Capsicum annuum]
MKDEQREGYCKEVAGDHYPSNSASDYILPHLLNLYASRAKAQDFEIYAPNATFEDPLMRAEGYASILLALFGNRITAATKTSACNSWWVKQIKSSFYSLGKVWDCCLRIIPTVAFCTFQIFSESRIVEYNVTEKEISPGNKEILIDNKQYYKFLGKDIHMISLIKLYTEGGKVVRHEDCWDKKPLRNRETVKVPLVGRMMEVSRRASMLLTHALMGFGKDPTIVDVRSLKLKRLKLNCYSLLDDGRDRTLDIVLR